MWVSAGLPVGSRLAPACRVKNNDDRPNGTRIMVGLMLSRL